MCRVTKNSKVANNIIFTVFFKQRGKKKSNKHYFSNVVKDIKFSSCCFLVKSYINCFKILLFWIFTLSGRFFVLIKLVKTDF